jgi:glycosyltransferase involved in cell wall biosynthesis
MFLSQISPLILPLRRDIPAIYHAVWYRAACPKGTKLLPNGESCQNTPGLSCLRERCWPPWDWTALMAQMWMFERWRGAFDAVVANSRSVQGRLREVGISSDVIWNGVPERGIRGDLSAEPVAGFAGRLVKEKGVDLLLRAFAQVPQGRLIVAGDGPERASLVNLATALGLEKRVSFLGQLSQSELERHFNSIWVQVIPSLWAEPFGFVAAEAMMRGSAVIASSSGGLGDVVQHNCTGLLVPSGELEPLQQSLTLLFEDRSLAERMGDAGREFAKVHLHETVMVDRFVQLYTRLIEKNQSELRDKP